MFQNQYPQIQLGYTMLIKPSLTLGPPHLGYQIMDALNLADGKPANPLHGISLLRVINNMLFVKHHLWEDIIKNWVGAGSVALNP